MALPVSIGDAIMLSRLAFQLGQAFTTGRKSAPAEFEEIRNLLYSLSKALELLARDLPDVSSSTSNNTEIEHNDVILRIISNCRMTLKHLEAIVGKYSILENDPSQLNKARVKSWSEDVHRNWKKVIWTKEGGDLSKLKVTLTAHMNSLTLAVSAATRHQGAVSHEDIKTIHTKLDEIHQWFLANLRANEPNVPRRSRAQILQHSPLPSDSNRPLLTFSIYEVLCLNSDEKIVCPHASFSDDWLLKANINTKRNIFQCHCLSIPPSQTGCASHSLFFCVLPVTLLVQHVASGSKRIWQTYVGSRHSNTPVSLCLTDVLPMHLAKFEAYIVELASSQVSFYKDQGISSMLVSHSSKEGYVDAVSVLRAKPPASDLIIPISTIFISNGFRFNPGHVESIQLLNYGMVPEASSSALSLELDVTHAMLPQSHAELILHCRTQGPDSGNEERYVIEINHDTTITVVPNQSSICLEDVLCTSETIDNDESIPQQIRCSTIDLRFSSTSAAESFSSSFHAMQRELFILYLQYPSYGEQVVYQRAAGDLMIRHCYLTNAHLNIVFNPITQEYRMILLSDCHSVSVCLELPQSFLETLSTTSPPPTRTYPAWFVEITPEGVTIEKQTAGLESLLTLHAKGNENTPPLSLPIRGAAPDEESGA